MLQACEAIGEAHAAGVVHRDIKPANLFLTTDASRMPCVKIFDLGISKLGGDLTLTQDAATMGSPLYMSPEQLNSSHDVDGRADLWSLGASLFELLAGQTPFHADTIQQLCFRIFSGQPTPLSRFRTDVPAGLEAVIMQCLEKDRNRRFNNIAELAAALAPWAPARAAAYPERVARVLDVQTKPARTTGTLSEPRGEPLLAAIQSNAAGAPPPSIGGTMLLPVRSAMASSPVASTQDTVLTRSNPQDARMGGQSAARVAGERAPVRLSRPVLTVGAVGVVALAMILGVKLRYSPTSGDSATTALAVAGGAGRYKCTGATGASRGEDVSVDHPAATVDLHRRSDRRTIRLDGLSHDVGLRASGFERSAHPTTETFHVEPWASQGEFVTGFVAWRHYRVSK